MDTPCASAAKPPSGRKMKARAPPPPGKPATPGVQRGQSPHRGASPVRQQNLLPVKEDLEDRAVALTVVLPSGLEKRSVVNGSHAMMDLLVELCLQNHLNPSHHALEIWSSETQQPLSFKPNTLVGTLNVHTIFLKEKVPEEKGKPGPPKMPEKSVRLVVNYLRTQKAVVRVSPEVPLHSILPVICAKCDVSPEHVVLLRDNVAGEELELSKSLSELGIKELYAWDNKRVLLTKTQSEPALSCRDTLRKASLGSEEAEKEKKKFLGFFKVNKRSNSKVEPRGLTGADSDEDTLKSATSRGLNGCLTTPSSPSVNSRSLTLGPSLSLSNISGVSFKSDVKKRRAPPPPSLPGTGPPAPDKTSEKMSLGSQMDLQKKKRRAPAPPPPSPLVPPRSEDRDDKRKSATGVGRQVPQKPPRGTARGPPQLVLPPPPPYPPPDTDAAVPHGFPGEGAAPEASDPRPTLSLPLGPGSPCGTDGVPQLPSEAEETVSVGSCFASEDTTEDSGVVSSPSDIISLDSQHDSTKSKDKWATDQEDCSDQDLVGTPELGPPKNPAWERDGSGHGHWRSRTERAVTALDEDDKELLVTGPSARAPAHPDEDQEEMDDSYETDSSSLTGSINGVSGHCVPDATVPGGDADAIPVTFIGEVLDDPVESGLFSNRNNNAGSFDRGSPGGGPAHLPPGPTKPQTQQGQTRAEGPEVTAAPHGVGREIGSALSDACRDVNPVRAEPRVTSERRRHDQNAEEVGREQGSVSRGRAWAPEAVRPQPTQEKGGSEKKDVSAPLSWYQQDHNPGGSFGLKYGLTTYKIVPPKSEMRCYDRGVSLSTGAIRIDELGNLVNPHPNGARTTALPPPALEKDAQPPGRVGGLRRSNSTEKRSGWPTGSSARRPHTPTPAPTTPAGPRAEPGSPDPTARAPPQPPAPQGDGRRLEVGDSQPPAVATCPTKVPAAHTPQVLFLKPQRRTSSQYVASAIAKRIGPPRAPADLARRPGGAQRRWESGEPELGGRPRAPKDEATRTLDPEPHVRKEEAKLPYGHPPSTNGEGSAVGAQPRGQVSSPPGKVSPHDHSAGIHRGPSIPLVTAVQRDHESMGLTCGFGEKQSVNHHWTSSASGPQRVPDSTETPPPGSGDAQGPGRSLVNGSRWVPVRSEPAPSPRASGGNSHPVLGQEEEPRAVCTDIQDADSSLPSSIFGPKKKFRPVVQRPAPKDTSLHSALMEAIHSAGGRDRLRKTAELSAEGGHKKPSYTESESEHAALLAAIRGHRGACSLRKVTSCASEELRGFREAARSGQGPEALGPEDLGSPPALLPPAPPAPPAPSTSRTVSRSSSGPLDSPVDARQALMDAIRSGTGAARLRKVPLLV
ncbi:protein cordon-bleu isoform X2 [Saccopteryx bilineata]|uniref:protein cordon-bleu isoform X2 n=1 Tax=Saccopteryx bilineata TaxID=59482 RepID=UPI00338F0421